MSIDYDNFGSVAAELLARLRSQRPLVHHITNFVVMNDTANATLALGALPVMAHAKEEVAEMVQAAGALVLNPGTLEPLGSRPCSWPAAARENSASPSSTIPWVSGPLSTGAPPASSSCANYGSGGSERQLGRDRRPFRGGRPRERRRFGEGGRRIPLPSRAPSRSGSGRPWP